MVRDRRWMNRGRMGKVKTHRDESQSEEKETEQEASATWTREDRTKGGRGIGKTEKDWMERNRLHREGTQFSAVGEAKFRWGTKVLYEANTKKG